MFTGRKGMVILRISPKVHWVGEKIHFKGALVQVKHVEKSGLSENLKIRFCIFCVCIGTRRKCLMMSFCTGRRKEA